MRRAVVAGSRRAAVARTLVTVAVACRLLTGSAPAAAQAASCAGDCDGNGSVSISELVQAVNVALGDADIAACPAADRMMDGAVGIADLVAAVNAALDGCPATPTPSAVATPTARATATLTPTSTVTDTPTATASTSASPTLTATLSASPTPSLPPTITPGTCSKTPLGNDGVKIDSFESDDGTKYFVVAVDGHVAAGAQITSFVFGDDPNLHQSLENSHAQQTAMTRALPGTLAPQRLWHTDVLRDFPNNTVVLNASNADGEFNPCANGGAGMLVLPDGQRTVTFSAGSSGGTEVLHPATQPSGSADTFVPAAIVKRVQRRISQLQIDGDIIVFPAPGPARCVGGATAECVDDQECPSTCLRDGQGCCARTSHPPTCDNVNVCDLSAALVDCLVGSCQPGGDADGQTVTLDDDLCSRVGNPASQADVVDGFFLRSTVDLIVFVVPPGGKPPASVAAAAGFLVSAAPLQSRTVLGATGAVSHGAPPVPCKPTSVRPVRDRALSKLNRIPSQVFVSDNGKVYWVLASVPDPGDPNNGIGVQVTSVMMATSATAQLAERSGFDPTDPVLTSVSALRAGSILGNGLSGLRRTGVVTGLVFNRIEDMGNPLNGLFDKSANGGNGLLTLPGGVRTVDFDGTGTEPVLPISMGTGDGVQFVPPATLASVSRRVGLERIVSAPSIVFPFPFVNAVPSSGATCLGGTSAGSLCNPADHVSPECTDGSGCLNRGGETAHQNVTLDDTVGTRVGNADSQGPFVDGFFLRDFSNIIVFMADAGNPAVVPRVSAAGFRVTGTCSNAISACTTDLDCAGGSCTDDVAARTVASAAVADPPGGLKIQHFVSDNGFVYFVLRSDPAAGSVGTQVTSIAAGIGQLTQLSEPQVPGDAVLTSLSAGTSFADLASVERTQLLTAFTSNLIDNANPCNPLNGCFDPAANGGTGLLTLPGGTRTVAADGTGTEPVNPLTLATGAGVTRVPEPQVVQVSRQIGSTLLSQIPTIVFPNPSGTPVVSSGPRCAGGQAAGLPCDPSAPGAVCADGTCTDLGGEAPLQNVTLDDTVGSRIGNPVSQQNAVDGFFLENNTVMIVFVVDAGGLPGPVSLSASGFSVSGTCSNASTTPCADDSACAQGSSCTAALAARNVIAATGDTQ